ncbi:chromate efflux transporter [Psychrosphaera aestuarii]|uniref:chromate efflux transporter n=1 Tax=Psychrosphaera aestuarii TaxID=1266052 RepID=UPI001FD1130C|nr:chromate efflux transporter [Psychrosphaera aestuarii]
MDNKLYLQKKMKALIDIFFHFFLLGCISFGGPAAHIGYFQKTFVEKLKWVSQERYSGYIALSQFLPGPGSSQVGFSIGYSKGGLLGGVAAFIAFTAPSFMLMLMLAKSTAISTTASPIFLNVVSMLKILAVAVVADAIFTMYKQFCNNAATIAVTLLSAILLCIYNNIIMQLAIISISLLAGSFFYKKLTLSNVKVTTTRAVNKGLAKVNWFVFGTFILLFIVLPLLTLLGPKIALFSDFYRAGSLVFGGGHVVLPMLEDIIQGQLSKDTFIFGYAAAQAIPGPMFTFATFLGAELLSDNMLVGALIATVAIFLPGFLLIIAFKESWQKISKINQVAGAIACVNAAVVGLLISAFYQPILVSAIHSYLDVLIAVAGFLALRVLKIPVLYVVVIYMVVGVSITIF